jgi:hypothetical protein
LSGATSIGGEARGAQRTGIKKGWCVFVQKDYQISRHYLAHRLFIDKRLADFVAVSGEKNGVDFFTSSNSTKIFPAGRAGV